MKKSMREASQIKAIRGERTKGTIKISSSLIKQPVSPDEITSKILLFRDKKVMFDSGLAKLYGVPTDIFN